MKISVNTVCQAFRVLRAWKESADLQLELSTCQLFIRLLTDLKAEVFG